MNGMKRTSPPTHTHHQFFHCPGAAALAVTTDSPCSARNVWSVLGTLVTASSRVTASPEEILNAPEISLTAWPTACPYAGELLGSFWRMASTWGLTTPRVCTCCGYCAWIVCASGP